MKIISTLICTLFSACVLLPLVTHASPLDKKISFEASPGYEFFHFCQSLDILCGVDSLLGPFSDEVLEIESMPGRKALSILMAHNPGYTSEFRKGMLSVFPKQRDQKSPIDRRISVHFSSKTLAEISAALNKEMDIGMSRSVSGWSPEDPTKISIDADNITVREVLNRAVRAHGHSLWVLRRKDSSGPTPFYDLELYSYWTPKTRDLLLDRTKGPNLGNTGGKLKIK